IHPFYIDDIVLTGSPISTDASLFDLGSSEGSIDPLFDPFVYEYSVELPIGTSATPTLTATPAEDNSTVDIADAADVTSDNVEDRTSVITVTAPDGVTTQTYSVVFSVLPNNDATLANLETDNGSLDPEFSAITFDYDVELPAGTTATPVVTAAPADDNATVDITDASDVTSENEADRTTTIVVTAEDGTTTLTYSILFTRSTVSVGEVSAGSFQVYPNPATDQLHINNGSQISGITIANVLGEIVMNRNIESESVQLNISDLDAGYYILKIKTKDGNEITTSFMKK
ncbi:MAG: T9SS type A sorting domain-containing protein, partial [Bacteroidales bacterium]